jgi:hypothetical protein
MQRMGSLSLLVILTAMASCHSPSKPVSSDDQLQCLLLFSDDQIRSFQNFREHKGSPRRNEMGSEVIRSFRSVISKQRQTSVFITKKCIISLLGQPDFRNLGVSSNMKGVGYEILDNHGHQKNVLIFIFLEDELLLHITQGSVLVTPL